MTTASKIYACVTDSGEAMEIESIAIDEDRVNAYSKLLARDVRKLRALGLDEEAAALRDFAADRVEKARREAAAADPRIQAVAAMARGTRAA